MRFLTINDLKDILQVSEKKAKAIVRIEDFPSIRLGAEYRVEEGAFLQWVQSHYNKPVKLDYSKV